jgi:hypothetical protein
MVAALIQHGEASLTRWLPYLPCHGLQAQSKQQRMSRWLHNSLIKVHRLYKPLIKLALATWGERCLYLNLDTSLYWKEYSLVRLSVVYRVRALPIIWRVLNHDSASVAFEAYQEILPRSPSITRRGEGGSVGRPGLCSPQCHEADHYYLRLALPDSDKALYLDLAVG